MKIAKLRKSLIKAYRRLRCRVCGGHRVLMLADSHAGVFEYIFDHDLLAPHWINCDIVGGSTGYGLNKDRSSTDAYRKFLVALERYRDYDVVGIMLGEVDCCSALWLKAQATGQSPLDFLPLSLKGIERLVQAVHRSGRGQRVVLFGAILPTVQDHQVAHQDTLLRREVRASLRERTDLVLAFNARLQQLAAHVGAEYADITAETLDPVRGVVKDDMLITDRIDHHQSQSATAPFWAATLKRLLANRPPVATVAP